MNEFNTMKTKRGKEAVERKLRYYSETHIHHFWRDCEEKEVNARKWELKECITCVKNVHKQQQWKLNTTQFPLITTQTEHAKSYFNTMCNSLYRHSLQSRIKNYVENMSVHDLATVTKPPGIFSWNLVQKYSRVRCSASTNLKRIGTQWKALFT